ncbi:MAG: YqaA family protein [Candidatus Asgardarchaeia archaeon]|nr:VTT domain-containing protein [Candidatus Odinarchaeota archaeon]
MDDADYVFMGLISAALAGLYFFQESILWLSDQFFYWMIDFASTYGYLGAFIISIFGNFTIIFPVPYSLAIFLLGASHQVDPLILGLISGLGAQIGEMSAYLLGRGVSIAELEEKYGDKFKKVNKMVENYGFWTIMIFAATPLPDDLVLIPAGIIGYDLKKTIIACLIGKVILTTFLAYAGYYSMEIVAQFFSESGSLGMFISLIGIIVISYLLIKVDWIKVMERLEQMRQNIIGKVVKS